MKFSKKEIRDLIISMIILSFAFGGIENFLIALFALGFSFLAHEVLGHKAVAQYYGCYAEFRAWGLGLILAILTSLLNFGIIFAVPGAVYVSNHVRKKGYIRTLSEDENGKISLAGPAVNIIIGFVLLIISIFNPEELVSINILAIMLFTAKISFFLAFLNLLPIPPLDGISVLKWNKIVWIITIFIAASGYLFLYF